jgi:hypothetical protein
MYKTIMYTVYYWPCYEFLIIVISTIYAVALQSLSSADFQLFTRSSRRQTNNHHSNSYYIARLVVIINKMFCYVVIIIMLVVFL